MPAQWLQPRFYHSFRCLGADCEDTCCSGWMVSVDRQTFDRYQECPDPELGPRLRELVTINTNGSANDSYARITLSGATCPFLSEGLCSIHKNLGESYLSVACSKFPRMFNRVDGVLHRSLDLACPEAARLALLDPKPMEFDEAEGAPRDPRLGMVSVLTTGDGTSRKPYRHYREIRAFLIELLQYRAYPLWKRLVILSAFCDQLEELAEKGLNGQVPEAIAWFRNAIHTNSLDQAIDQHRPMPALQLELVLELIVARISGEYTSPRFFECYQAFMRGVEWTSNSSMDEIGLRYATVYAGQFVPFLAAHGHILEHYLVSYVHRTLFPLGAQDNQRDPMYPVIDFMREQCLLMLVYFGIVQTVLVGMAGFHFEQLTPAHAIQLVQAVTKAFEHNAGYAQRALTILAEKGVKTGISMAILIMN